MRSEERLPSAIDQVRRHLAGFKKPRALEVLDYTMRQLERGEIGALEARAVAHLGKLIRPNSGELPRR